MHRWRHRVVTALVAVAVSGCATVGDKAGGTTSPDPVILVLVHAVAAAELRPFTDQVERLSHGALRIALRGVPRTAEGDDDMAVVDALSTGGADLAVVPAIVPTFGAGSFAEQEAMFRDPDATAPGSAVQFSGVGALPGPLLRPAGVTRPLLGPASYRGVRVAMRPGAGVRPLLAALDAVPVPHNLRGEEAFTADAIVAPLTDIASNVYDGVVTTLTANVVLGFRPLFVLVRNGQSPTTDRLALLAAAARAAAPATFDFRRAEEEAAITALCRRGRVDLVTAAPDDLAALRQAAMASSPAPATEIPPPDTVSCARVAGDTAATLVDGVYEVPAPGGARRITLARGRFDDAGSPGTYTVHGDVLVLTYPAHPGRLVYRWTRHDDQLTLSPVAGRNSPEELRTAPWRRLGDAPPAARTPVDGVYENGVFQWTLDRGQLRQTRGSTWAAGSYTVAGDLLTATYSETGGEPVTSGPVRPGETVRYRWNLFRGWLRLTPVGGAPAILAGTWRRGGDPP